MPSNQGCCPDHGTPVLVCCSDVINGYEWRVGAELRNCSGIMLPAASTCIGVDERFDQNSNA